jgi:hypothetical protein
MTFNFICLIENRSPLQGLKSAFAFFLRTYCSDGAKMAPLGVECA